MMFGNLNCRILEMKKWGCPRHGLRNFKGYINIKVLILNIFKILFFSIVEVGFLPKGNLLGYRVIS